MNWIKSQNNEISSYTSFGKVNSIYISIKPTQSTQSKPTLYVSDVFIKVNGNKFTFSQTFQSPATAKSWSTKRVKNYMKDFIKSMSGLYESFDKEVKDD